MVKNSIMPDPIGIQGGISNVGSQPQRNLKYEHTASVPSTPQTSKLRVGEILQGTVVEVHSSQEAVVRLPIGTVTATLQGKLNRGDILFFKVIETEPKLLLRIYGISSKFEGKDVDVRDILRVLDLKDNAINREIINLLTLKRATITKDDVGALLKSLSILSDSVLKQNYLKDIFITLFFMQEIGLPTSEKMFTTLLPVFLGGEYLRNLLKQLESSLANLPPDIAEKIKSMMMRLTNSETDAKDLLNFFKLRNPTSEDSFMNLTKEIISLDRKNLPVELSKTIQTARNIFATIYGQQMYNVLAWQSFAPIYLFIPIQYKTDYRIVQLKIQRQKIDGKAGNLLHFSFVLNTLNLNEILVEGTMINNMINTSFYVKTEEIAEFIDINMNQLKKSIIDLNLLPQNFQTHINTNQRTDFIEDISKPRQQNFAVVI